MPDEIGMAQVPQYFGYAEQKNAHAEEYIALENRQKEKERLYELAKTRAKIIWKKVYENKEKGSRIYHLKYKKFAYHTYKKDPVYVSIFDNKNSLAIDIKDIKNDDSKRIIFLFTKNKLRLYISRPKIKHGKRAGQLKSFSALRFKSGILAEPLKYSYPAQIKQLEERIKNLIIKKCRANKIKLPFNTECDSLEQFIRRAKFASLAQILENKQGVDLDRNSLIIFFKDAFRLPIKQCVRRITGFNSKAVTREFIKAVCEGRTGGIVVSHLLKGKIPIDYVIELLASNSNGYKYFGPKKEEFLETKKTINFFYEIHKGDVKHFAQLLLNSDGAYQMTDSIRLLNAIKQVEPEYIPEKCKNFEEYHTNLTRYLNRIKNKDRDIKHPQIAYDLGLNGEKLGDYELVLPTRTHELKDWGEQMHNCIGGYYYSIENGYSLIYGLKLNGEIKYGIELDPDNKQIRQFRGKYNEDAPVELHNLLTEKIFEKIQEKRLDWAKDAVKLKEAELAI